jgi:4-hydroxy-tetrahydrodipicolinate synthase
MKSKYITPSVTLFRENGSIDLDAMKKHYDYLINGGVDGILVLGSIGEFFSISMEEKKKLITCAVNHIHKRVPVIIGTTSMEVHEIIELSKYAKNAGADACIVLPPFYFPLSDKSIKE